ncbi:MAG TPA: ATP-dependent DNA helicase [Candidatus Xenobia bacterium]|nr:ATP-dependent DNA helicase [Candidatus Xenobia bacterium]
MTSNPAAPTAHLNPAQREAVEHLHGPLLVIAGAGTGKTRVIVERVLHLLRTIPELGGENILALTYTRKAAAEMAARIRRLGDKRAERVGVHTFHDFCYKLLRTHDEALRILDDVDYWIFLRRQLDRLGLDLFQKLSDPGRFLHAFKDFFSRCQDELVSPEDYAAYVAGLARAFEEERGLLAEAERSERELELRKQRELARAYEAAERLLAEARRTTFGGSQLSAVQLLERRADLREHYQERFRYILVDEFQDVNIAQIRLLELLSARHRNLTAVGDDDQAIYRFRGASYASFDKFRELFPDARRVILSQNYRSTARLLRVATQLISQNGTARFDPHKKLTPMQGEGEKARLVEVNDAAHEAAFVVREIERYREATGGYAGCAVLYRNHAHRNQLVKTLVRAGIPFVIRGLSVTYSGVVRDLLAYLRAVQRPGDNVSFARLLAIPAWQVTPEQLLELLRKARHERVSLAQVVEGLSERIKMEQTRIGPLLALLADLRVRAADLPVTEFFDLLREKLEIRLLPADPDLPYVEAFAEFLKEWENDKSETKRLAELIDYLDYFEEAGGTIELPDEPLDREAVQLMTVHTAKGLEFDTVFLLRVNPRDFPVYYRSPLFEFPPELMKETKPPAGDFHIQEERRLCYVALTRARRRLTITTYAWNKKPSVFLEDILRDPRAARDLEQLMAPPVAPPQRVERPATLFPSSGAIYSRIAAWAAEALPADDPDEPVVLSKSGIESYESCPLQYKLGNMWGLRGGATPAMAFGLIMHRSVVEYFRARQKRGEVTPQELLHLYEQQWRQAGWPFPDAYQREQYRASGWRQLQEFHENQAEQEARVLELEKEFRWAWDETVELTGRIDQINQLDGHAVEIVEYKTGEPRPPEKVRKDLQLALYAAAAEKHLGLRPQRLTLYNLTANQPISFAPEEKEIAKALQRARDVADAVRAGEFDPKPGYVCKRCPYTLICPEFEQLVSAPPAEEEATEEENSS